ncbi:TPR repeat, SEL1 subfamily [hydrothermal vent metagenome]|uniref:TPR repeat, SEL1 subfamily n=1 Tax=hydrothermal vent metagenome TaxID=652676 RepID=A0A3B0RIT0_9ZZZZ
MAGNGPWSVKGIDPKARAAAKQAAQRAGVTLGEWLSNKMLAETGNGVAAHYPEQPAPDYRNPGYASAVLPALGGHRSPVEPQMLSEVEALARRLEATEHRSTLAITGIDQTVLGLLARLEGVEKSQIDVTERLVQSLETLDVRLEQADQQAGEFSTRVDRQLKDTARRIDTLGEQSDTNASAMRHELGKDVELINNRSDEISQRLAVAEKQTDNAIRTLEASFVSVSERLIKAEKTIHSNSDTGLSEKFDKRFALISNELVKVVAETRGQLAAQIQAQAADPKLAQMEDAMGRIQEKFTSTENRHANTLEQIAVAVSKLGVAVENRLEQSEERSETRLLGLQQEQASALEKVGQSMAEVAERLEYRFEQAEAEKKQQIAQDDLEARLRESESRTSQLVEDAMQRVHQRLDETTDQNAADISPVQKALNTLTERLGALEERPTPPFADVSEDNSPAWNADMDAGTELGELVQPQPTSLATDPAPFEQPSLPPLGEADGFDGSDTFAVQPDFMPKTYPQNVAAPALDQQSQTIGATADQNFLNSARRSMQENAANAAKARQAIYPAGQPAPGQASKSNAGQNSKNKKLYMAASLIALLAIGVAATVTLFDFGNSSRTSTPQMASNLPLAATFEDDVLNGSNTPSKMAVAETITPPEQSPIITDKTPITPEPAPVQIAEIVAEPTPEPVRSKPEPVVAKPVVSKPIANKPVARPARDTSYDAPYSPPKSKPVIKPPTPVTTSRPQVVQVATRPTQIASPEQPISLIHRPQQNQRPSMEQAAVAGDPIAQYQYASSLVDSGQPQQAAQLMKAAAERGLPAAQYQLAQYYEGGTGVAADEREARRWTERAANGGNRRAMHNLAMFFAEGRTVPQSYDNAAKWFEEAALLGLANSQFNLAFLYEQGLGVPKSLPDAFAWYSIAAKAGDRGAAEKLDKMRAQLPAAAVTEAETITARFRPRPLDMAANGVFQNINWSRPQTDDPNSVTRSQILLSRLGYQPGPADGNIGEQTRLAIIAYERDNGLAQTGRIDAKLLSKLENSTVN